jgi:hypothetical protein
MVSYTCERCKKSFNKKCDFRRHTELKKKPCEINNLDIVKNLQTEKAITQNKERITQNLHIGAEFTQNKECITQNLHIGAEFTQNKEQCKAEFIPIINIEVDFIEKNKTNEVNACKYCNKMFKRLFNLNRHFDICNIKKDIIEKTKIETDSLKNKDVENEILKNENEILKNEQKIKNDEIEKLKNTVETLNNGSIVINNNNNIQINIVNYREEDFSKLDLNKILKYDNSFIEMVFRDIHCNSELPENQNILLPSLSRYDIYIKLNNEWLKRNKNEILKERYSTIRGHIMDLYTEESEKNKKKADQMYFHFLKQIKLVDPTTKIYKPHEEKKIIEGIANVLYNHKDNIKSIIKTSLMPKIK